MEMKEDVISYLRRRRKQLRLKQQDVADYLNVSKSAICQFEGYRATLSKEKINKYFEFIKLKEILM